MHSVAGDVSLGRRVLRRQVNDRISGVAPERTAEIEVFCECGRSRCAERVRVAADVYLEVRGVPGRFVVAAQHTDGGAAGGGYVVLHGRAGR